MRITTRARGKNKRHRHNHIIPTIYLYVYMKGGEWKTDEQIELPEAAGLRPKFANNRRRRPLPIPVRTDEGIFAHAAGPSSTYIIIFKRHAILLPLSTRSLHTHTHTLQWYIFHTPTSMYNNIILYYCRGETTTIIILTIVPIHWPRIIK